MTRGPFGPLISKALPYGLVRRHGKDLVAHGTSTSAADAALRGGIRSSVSGNLGGGGVYTTNSMTGANVFGAHTAQGAPHGGRRPGKVLMFKPAQAPIKSQPFYGKGSKEKLFTPEQLGKPVHVQNVNRTTAARSIARTFGEKPLPKTGYRPPAPTPVSRLSRSQIAARKQAVLERRGDPDDLF